VERPPIAPVVGHGVGMLAIPTPKVFTGFAMGATENLGSIRKLKSADCFFATGLMTLMGEYHLANNVEFNVRN
jgi:hypothetical protein